MKRDLWQLVGLVEPRWEVDGGLPGRWRHRAEGRGSQMITIMMMMRRLMMIVHLLNISPTERGCWLCDLNGCWPEDGKPLRGIVII